MNTLWSSKRTFQILWIRLTRILCSQDDANNLESISFGIDKQFKSRKSRISHEILWVSSSACNVSFSVAVLLWTVNIRLVYLESNDQSGHSYSTYFDVIYYWLKLFDEQYVHNTVFSTSKHGMNGSQFTFLITSRGWVDSNCFNHFYNCIFQRSKQSGPQVVLYGKVGRFDAFPVRCMLVFSALANRGGSYITDSW